ncbi:Uncharacterised protein [Mycolicibacterium phlei]|jgi:hypothetical protein|uniref:Uncharacterized protein n=1 Tax=Mycolicibacterium phlei DSM 43239 = CCUG 21000 TaxID=1226750 RepID=A0A5N5VB45_MYCPH|nr:DUF6188 family protein [Mycolicibacterium phlei]VEG08076.1 Uncharacterised protein [Mycobacteroides chelonae]AMO59951.1 hypothetical protein MPHLCCUG_01122 [Mycolicibacterium phlei]EID14687.1 hypothetical protein MPHLEI_10144 [Mycolicibacterium phlei RIVM601174]KAB7757729.1 hypothetical protein MPHL21000_06480 [Mycolicibacterium phlei DSM 43239 = CCUG 21000]KXW61286.1 hypothetical protein MPHL43239_22000 [Mycolicibacterium phlei DSM 43239 = CCUG 21000]
MATDLDLRGRAVVSVAKYDYTLWLKLMGGYGITIESPLTIDDVVLSPQDDPVGEFGPVRRLAGLTIEKATVDKIGTLQVHFRDGTRLVVEPDPHYEAWNVSRPDGSLIVCRPGGGLSRWAPPPER